MPQKQNVGTGSPGEDSRCAAIDSHGLLSYRPRMASLTYPVAKAQAQFPKLAKTKSVVTVTNRGEVACFIVSKEFMAATLETQEILADPKAMEALQNYEAGKTKFGTLDDIPD